MEKFYMKRSIGTFLMVQWLRLCAPNAGGQGLIPHAATKSLHATTKYPACWKINKYFLKRIMIIF